MPENNMGLSKNGRFFDQKKIVLATHNTGKKVEIKNLFDNINLEILSSLDLNLPVPIENGISFEENALLKATETVSKTGLPSLSDDSGICINALNGDPGVYSADWSGPERNFSIAFEKIKSLMKSKFDFSASMMCTLCLAWPDGYYEMVSGEMEGEIVFPARGEKGFGYDPIFVPKFQPFSNSKLTYGEIEPEFKNKNSARNFAFIKLLKRCFER